jgi:hypothetical protein
VSAAVAEGEGDGLTFLGMSAWRWMKQVKVLNHLSLCSTIVVKRKGNQSALNLEKVRRY